MDSASFSHQMCCLVKDYKGCYCPLSWFSEVLTSSKRSGTERWLHTSWSSTLCRLETLKGLQARVNRTLFVSFVFLSVLYWFFNSLLNFGGTQRTLCTQNILSYRHFAYSNHNGTLFVSFVFLSDLYWFFYSLLNFGGHKGHFVHRTFLARGTLPNLATTGHFLCPSYF